MLEIGEGKIGKRDLLSYTKEKFLKDVKIILGITWKKISSIVVWWKAKIIRFGKPIIRVSFVLEFNSLVS